MPFSIPAAGRKVRARMPNYVKLRSIYQLENFKELGDKKQLLNNKPYPMAREVSRLWTTTGDPRSLNDGRGATRNSEKAGGTTNLVGITTEELGPNAKPCRSHRPVQTFHTYT